MPRKEDDHGLAGLGGPLFGCAVAVGPSYVVGWDVKAVPRITE